MELTKGRSMLIAGPYIQPRVRIGDWLNDEIDGHLIVGGWTDGRISWPRRKKTGRHALILNDELARAVRNESSEAIQYWWGVGPTKVWQWRIALGVGRVTDGTRQLLQEHTGVPVDASARGREAAALPENIAKMAETKRGVPAQQGTRDALLRAAIAPKPKAWGMLANKRMQAAKK